MGQSLVLFYLFINDLFFSIKKSDACNFVDDNTLFCGDNNLDLVIINLNSDLRNVMDWFKSNSLKKLIRESSNLWSWVQIKMTVLT